ncbi:MAG: PadR family transcriptional regulator [Longimicrobiales bacterium]
MRITFPTATVLTALACGHGYGFEIIDVTGLRAGTVYPILRRLEEDRLVKSSWERVARARLEGRPPRRNYRLTNAGEQAVREVLERYPAIVRLFAGSGREGTAPA